MSENEAVPRGAKVTTYTLALNWLPFVYLAAGIAVVSLVAWRGNSLVAFALVWVYLVPPLVCRATVVIAGYPEGRGLDQQASAYRLWWFLTQWQMLFNRLPILEELLRLVPGLYPLWLNLWGGRVSAFAYWGPGARVIDRYLVHVERGAVIGTGATVSGHLGVQGPDGTFRMDIAPVTIGAGAIIGAGAGLAPGTLVAPDELVPAGRLLQPFSTWKGGRKKKG